MSKSKPNTNAIDFGISTEELRDQVIARATEQLVERIDSRDYNRMEKVLELATNTAVTKYIETVVVPVIQSQIETITFQATNQWGEAKGNKKLTFREYLIERAEKWLQEELSYDGKPKGNDSYNWRAHQTRIAHMIHEHLSFHIKRAVEEMLKTANEQLVGGIEKTVRLKLAEIQTALSIKTSMKSS